MARKTIVEKIFSEHAGQSLSAGDWCVVPLDFYSGTDTKSPKAVKMFEEMALPLAAPQKIAFGMDHYVPCGHEQRANSQKYLRDFAAKHNIRLFNPGDGVSIQLFMDNGLVQPGMLVGMAESHSPSLGAANCCSIAIGEAEFAALMATDNLWFKVPQSIKVELTGHLSPGVFARDVATAVMGRFGIEGASYQVLEYAGSPLADMDMGDRITLCNMVADIGAKSAIVPGDAQTTAFFEKRLPGKGLNLVTADDDATYARHESFNLNDLQPLVSLPHSIDNVAPVSEVLNTPVHQAIIGSCTNGRLADLEIAARILKGKKVASGVRLFVAPCSREIYLKAMELGIMKILMEAGAILLAPSCGPCTGFTLQGIPADGDNVISSANRNFKGRMGNKKASIFLASPATVAASALSGMITDPRNHI